MCFSLEYWGKYYSNKVFFNITWIINFYNKRHFVLEFWLQNLVNCLFSSYIYYPRNNYWLRTLRLQHKVESDIVFHPNFKYYKETPRHSFKKHFLKHSVTKKKLFCVIVINTLWMRGSNISSEKKTFVPGLLE